MNLFELSAKLSLDSSEYEQGINSAVQKSNTFGDVLKANLLSDTIRMGLSALWGALKRVSQAFIEIGKQAVEAYANYEQLAGGVETLFGDSAQRVLNDANQAFKTAGMSMNEYMETSIQSAASLISSLGGDQAKAAEMMNMSITDMADNVNKMGTTMEGVQNAYRGFSRGNFTMLDNLALGFSGTKEGMQELLDKAREISGFKYDISSYADIVEAIHVIQTEMHISGITAEEAAEAVRNGTMTEAEAFAAMGTTAKEAATTIQGSLSMTKSAWQNLLVGIADENADFDALVVNLIDSATMAGKNLIPRIEQVIGGIGNGVEKLLPIILDNVPKAISRAAPGILNALKNLGVIVFNSVQNLLTNTDWNALGKNIADGFKRIDWISVFAGATQIIGNALIAAFDIISGIAENINWLELFDGIYNSLIAVVTNIDWAALISTMFKLLGASIGGSGAIIVGLALTTWRALKSGFESTKDYFNKYIESAGGNIIVGMFNGILHSLINVGGWIYRNIFQPFIEGFKAAFGIHSPSTVMAQMGGYIVDGLINAIKIMPQKVLSIFNSLKSQVTSWGSGMVSSMVSIGGNLISGLWNGIGNKVSWITGRIKSFGNTVISQIKKIFGVHSPSTVMEQIGDYLAQGLAIGVEDNADKPINAISALSSDMTRAFDFTGISDTVNELSTVNRSISAQSSTASSINRTEIILGQILDVLSEIDNGIYDKVKSAIDGTKISWNDRELGRFVKTYA